jgi:hypothetical protein
VAALDPSSLEVCVCKRSRENADAESIVVGSSFDTEGAPVATSNVVERSRPGHPKQLYSGWTSLSDRKATRRITLIASMAPFWPGPEPRVVLTVRADTGRPSNRAQQIRSAGRFGSPLRGTVERSSPRFSFQGFYELQSRTRKGVAVSLTTSA